MNRKKKSTDLITYKGKVNVKIRKGNRVLSKNTFHNEGTKHLFEFLARCLKGDYSTVEVLRPKFIKLFTLGPEGEEIPTITKDVFNIQNKVTLTTPIYSANPNIEISSDEFTASYSTTFKFVIPFSQLELFSEDRERAVNLIALYSQTNKDILEKPSMYIVVKDENNPDLLGNLIPEEFYSSDLSQQNQYNLFIEWMTTFKNEGE